MARFIHNDRLIDALNAQAFTALNASPGARAFHDDLRARGLEHNDALRRLANRLVGIPRGLVAIAGEQAGGRGPNAALYSVVPSSAYLAGLYVESDLVSAAVADVTGRRVAEVSGNPNGAGDPVELVRGTVERACASAGIEVTRLSALVIGSPAWSTADRRPQAGGEPARLARRRTRRAQERLA